MAISPYALRLPKIISQTKECFTHEVIEHGTFHNSIFSSDNNLYFITAGKVLSVSALAASDIIISINKKCQR